MNPLRSLPNSVNPNPALRLCSTLQNYATAGACIAAHQYLCALLLKLTYAQRSDVFRV